MSSFTQRRFYALAAGLVVIVFGLTWYLAGWNIKDPGYKDLTELAKKTSPVPKPSSAPLPPAMPPPPQRDPKAIDPEIQKMADELADHSQTPTRDLEIVGEFISLYSKVFHSNPIGLNEDITAALIGHNPKEGILFPPTNGKIVKGQLVDRWGTPYWFHPNNSYQMEIRSAGADKNLFTPDDVVMNPSPDHAGMGLAQP